MIPPPTTATSHFSGGKAATTYDRASLRGQLRHVGLNAVFLQPRFGGVETYVRSLIPELLELRPDLRLTLFVNHPQRDYLADVPWAGEVEFVSHPLLGRRYTSALSELALLAGLSGRRNLDLLHSLAMTGPVHTRMPHVVSVHDLIWWRVPDSAERLTTLVWRGLVPLVARGADRVAVLSEATRDDVVELLRVPADRIDVVPLAGRPAEAAPAAEADVRERLGLGTGPVVLAVSSKRTHKNLLRLVRAMKRVRERCPGAVLVIPGNPTPHEAELRAAAEQAGLADAVRLPPYADAAELEALYALCSVAAVPSLVEGFGLPVLEAMQRGTPVACARISSLPEVAGDAARYFDPYDEDDISAALIDVIGDPILRARLAEAGRAQAAQFTWRRTAELTVATWERAVAAPRRR
jgi:glycosyltransferase involved in cell wall biosynthesis